MIDDILAQPHQIGDALWRVEAAGIPRRSRRGGLVVCGVGGSAVGSDLARDAIGNRATAPLRTFRGYDLPGSVGEDNLVLLPSYSGSTEETLACFEAAGAVGAQRVALTTGGELAERARAEGVPVIGVPSGMQPRSSVVYMTVGVLECAAACGAVSSLREEIEAAAPLLEELAAEWVEGGLPAEIAERLHGKIPIVHGAAETAAVARRWKTQINENAKATAFASALPEANHNEIEGWEGGLALAPFAAVFLSAAGQHERIARRTELMAEQLERLGAPVVRAAARGSSAVDHVLSLVMLGDIVSVRMAELRGVDPGPIPAIEGFKAALS